MRQCNAKNGKQKALTVTGPYSSDRARLSGPGTRVSGYRRGCHSRPHDSHSPNEGLGVTKDARIGQERSGNRFEHGWTRVEAACKDTKGIRLLEAFKDKYKARSPLVPSPARPIAPIALSRPTWFPPSRRCPPQGVPAHQTIASLRRSSPTETNTGPEVGQAEQPPLGECRAALAPVGVKEKLSDRIAEAFGRYAMAMFA
jgi:hypothetical protein